MAHFGVRWPDWLVLGPTVWVSSVTGSVVQNDLPNPDIIIINIILSVTLLGVAFYVAFGEMEGFEPASERFMWPSKSYPWHRAENRHLLLSITAVSKADFTTAARHIPSFRDGCNGVHTTVFAANY